MPKIEQGVAPSAPANSSNNIINTVSDGIDLLDKTHTQAPLLLEGFCVAIVLTTVVIWVGVYRLGSNLVKNLSTETLIKELTRYTSSTILHDEKIIGKVEDLTNYARKTVGAIEDLDDDLQDQKETMSELNDKLMNIISRLDRKAVDDDVMREDVKRILSILNSSRH